MSCFFLFCKLQFFWSNRRFRFLKHFISTRLVKLQLIEPVRGEIINKSYLHLQQFFRDFIC